MLLLAACVIAGFGVTYLSQVRLNLEERIVFGTVLGAMAIATVSFILSMAVRDVNLFTVLTAAFGTTALAAAITYLNRGRLTADVADARARWAKPLTSSGHPWPVVAIFFLCAAWTVPFFANAYQYLPDGLYAGYINIWGDWAAHLSFTGSFAYGHNFPPEFPIDPGNHLGYPFMMDFLAANLVPLGVSLTSSLVLTSGLLGLAFPAVMYLAASRFAGGWLAGAIATVVFLMSGGLGFVYLLGDVAARGLRVLSHLPREYTLDRELNFQWLNPVLAYLVPQRTTLFGFSLALIVLLLVWRATREELAWPAYLFAGVVAGLMPAFHVHAWGTVVALSLFWFLLTRRREWIAFFVPAVVLAVPVLAWMWPPANNSFCGAGGSVFGYCIEPGWLAYTDIKHDGLQWAVPDFVWFWIKNTSLLIPLIIAGHFLNRWIPTRFATWFAPMWLWFAVPSVIVLQPWDWDNTKFFIFFALLGSIVAGAVLAALFQRLPLGPIAAALLLGLMVLSGGLDLARALDTTVSSYQFIDTRGLQLADWVRSNTPTDAIFLVADEHNSPIPTLSGRRIVIGYPGWLFTYGLADYAQKTNDAQLMLQGDHSTPELLKEYHVDYVLIGPQELSAQHGAAAAYWAQVGHLVYDNGEYRLYRVPGSP
ncbi:MAG TPA: hypothetical protein VGV88_07440 [Candidatus Dormibacteraeota bacterium]|nr:hypothetical protein [Candidatus Dormibacteraeota bacterium]